MKDERGLSLSIPVIIAAVAGILGISIYGSINWQFITILFALVTAGIAILAGFIGAIPLKYSVFISIAATASVTIFSIGAFYALAMIVIGFAAYYMAFIPGSKEWLVVSLIGAGIFLAIYGQQFTYQILGVAP
jgi:hypothetical protein